MKDSHREENPIFISAWHGNPRLMWRFPEWASVQVTFTELFLCKALFMCHMVNPQSLETGTVMSMLQMGNPRL